VKRGTENEGADPIIECRLGLTQKAFLLVITEHDPLDLVAQIQNFQDALCVLCGILSIRSTASAMRYAGGTHRPICVRQSPHTASRTVDILQELPRLWVRLKHFLEWERAIALFIKIYGIYKIHGQQSLRESEK
jgi:hypothetical protein